MADTLTGGQGLEAGQSLTSNNGAYTLTLQDDGNLVLTDGGGPVWASDSSGHSAGRAEVQSDGNFVVYDNGGGALWSSNTEGRSDVKLVLQDDRNLVLYSGADSVWSSGTQTDVPPSESDTEVNVRRVTITDGAVGHRRSVQISARDVLRVELPECASTGFVWVVKSVPSTLVQIDAHKNDDEPKQPQVSYGVRIEKVFLFEAAASPSSPDNQCSAGTLVLELRRRWQAATSSQTVQEIDVEVQHIKPRDVPGVEWPRTYTVVSGDTLWAIAERFYGDGNQYQKIADASGISNPDLIQPGQGLVIP